MVERWDRNPVIVGLNLIDNLKQLQCVGCHTLQLHVRISRSREFECHFRSLGEASLSQEENPGNPWKVIIYDN